MPENYLIYSTVHETQRSHKLKQLKGGEECRNPLFYPYKNNREYVEGKWSNNVKIKHWKTYPYLTCKCSSENRLDFEDVIKSKIFYNINLESYTQSLPFGIKCLLQNYFLFLYSLVNVLLSLNCSSSWQGTHCLSLFSLWTRWIEGWCCSSREASVSWNDPDLAWSLPHGWKMKRQNEPPGNKKNQLMNIYFSLIELRSTLITMIYINLL